ncbi:MAG: carboxypeptidase regulatory-like domain-containing protein [bacterium]|nr:carboxypeptidase regulatory-like domain-containing protein [bacterium]
MTEKYFYAAKLSLCLLVLLVLVGPAPAQEYRAVLQGQVMDATGGAIPGVKIVLINTETAVQVQTESTATGNYVLPRWIPAAIY